MKEGRKLQNKKTAANPLLQQTFFLTYQELYRQHLLAQP